MNEAKSNTRIHKVCIECEKYSFCDRDVNMRKRCYQRWYNQTHRDPQVEKLRLALYRQKHFARWMRTRTKSQAAKSWAHFGLDQSWFETELAKGVCSVTGLPFVLPSYQPGAKGKRGPWTPSVDRIDNKKGYTKSNSRLVVWIYNLAKNSYEDADILKMCAALASSYTMRVANIASNERTVTTTVPLSALTRYSTHKGWVRDNGCTSHGIIQQQNANKGV